MAWPPDLPTLKQDMGKEADDVRNDAQLQRRLDAAVAKVEELRQGEFNFEEDPLSDLPAPNDDLMLGTLMLAKRWYERRNSPNGLISSDQFGSNRIPWSDPDIDRLLGIGRYAPARFA